jgi:hypothetical protein
MNEIACQCRMQCTAINDMDCMYYQPSDTIEGEKIRCIYHTENECTNITANQTALLQSIDCLFNSMEKTINAKQTAIDMYEEYKEKKEMQTA